MINAKTLDSVSLKLAQAFLGKEVEVVMDRPLGWKHPRKDFIHEVNYGYIEGVKASDDAYFLDVDVPLERAAYVCIAHCASLERR